MRKKIKKPAKSNGKRNAVIKGDPKYLVLSEDERLKFENVQLRITMANQELTRLLMRRAGMEKVVAERVGVDIRGWQIDIEKGIISRPQAKAN